MDTAATIEGMLVMIDRVKFLEDRQTELQARNTELVMANRELQMDKGRLEYLFNTFEEDKKIVSSLMPKPMGVEPAEDQVENKVMALYLLKLVMVMNDQLP